MNTKDGLENVLRGNKGIETSVGDEGYKEDTGKKMSRLRSALYQSFLNQPGSESTKKWRKIKYDLKNRLVS